MTRRTLSSLGAIAICAVFHFPVTSLQAGPEQQQQPFANNAVSITDDTPETKGGSGREQSHSEDTDAPPEITPENTPEIAPGGGLSDSTGIANESRALGTPNGMFSNRPADPEETSDESFLSRFDPRENEFLRIVVAMVVVIGLLVLLRLILQKTTSGLGGAGRPSGVLEILARYPVARGQQLMLLKLGRRIILTHQTSTGMATISEVSDSDEVASLLTRIETGTREKTGSKFSSLLSGFEEEHSRQGGIELPHHTLTSPQDGELIDLTRRRRAGKGGRGGRWNPGGLFGSRRAAL